MVNKKTRFAIQVLQSQIDKGNDPNIHYPSWKIQSQSLIEKYFSKNCKEYSWFDTHKFSDAHYGYNVEEHYRKETLKAIKDIQSHLLAAIDTLKVKDIYKPYKPNFLARLSDTWLTTLLVLNFSAYGLMFVVGRWTVDVEKSNSIAPSISPTLPVSEDKPRNQTDTTKNNTRN